ncbi:hypothetical protein MMC14_006085 [Varicellaria rhodocarpa]|nr:hypothetical protein [Varicellaria rhodocarpa]
MQSSNKFTNAHETSPVSDFAIALVCGDAEFKMCSGVIVIDGNRLRFSVSDWIIMLLLKNLRMQLKDILSQTFKAPRKALSQEQEFWWGIWQTMFSKEAGAS